MMGGMGLMLCLVDWWGTSCSAAIPTGGASLLYIGALVPKCAMVGVCDGVC
jgi:hypothetical protein